MIIKFSKNLDKEYIYGNGDALAIVLAKNKDADGKRIYRRNKTENELVTTFDNPVLVTDNYRISRIKSSTLRDTIFRLFEFPVRTTEYDGTSIEFEQKRYPGLWGPSIDTILGCYAMKDLDLSKVKTMA